MSSGDGEEFDLAALVRLVWRYRLLVFAVGFASAVLVAVWVFTEKPYFRADVVVTDARDRGMGGASALASQLGGLASLAGVNLAPGNLAASEEAAAVLNSHHLAEEFIQRDGLLPILRRASRPDASLWRAVKLFKDGVLTVRKDLRTGVTTIAVEWTDPPLAARWANDYVALANELIRNRALEESTRNITYLNEQLSKTNDVELRKVMYNLIENETKTLMMAKGRADYAFAVVDPAVAPELKVGPHRLLATLIGFVLGCGFATLVAFVHDRFVRRRRLAQAPH
jgi:uncharacterized protein involved in exopolysaccharide biosynthesis